MAAIAPKYLGHIQKLFVKYVTLGFRFKYAFNAEAKVTSKLSAATLQLHCCFAMSQTSPFLTQRCSGIQASDLVKFYHTKVLIETKGVLIETYTLHDKKFNCCKTCNS